MAGGDDNQTLSVNDLTFLHNIHMAVKSREKRAARRQRESAYDQFRVENAPKDILHFVPKNRKQQVLWNTIEVNTITIAVGPSGVGKTLVALWRGLSEISKGNLKNIHYIRSDVGCEHQRGRGALPGDLQEKLGPLTNPVLDNLSVICKSQSAGGYLMEKGVIQASFLEDIRGRSLNESLIIFDESQNSTPDQVKTVLTRVGENSKIVLTGDTSQTDMLVFKKNNGLLDAYHRLSHIHGVGRVQFMAEDVVRNGIIADVIRAYEE